MIYVIVAIISFLITNCLVPKILLISLRKRLIDVPNMRKIHRVISSRLGGVSFYPSIIISISVTIVVSALFNFHPLAASVSTQFMIASVACFIMYLTGLFDDIAGVRYRLKFMLQLVSASLIVFSGIWIDNFHGFMDIYHLTAYVGMPFSILLIIFIINAINLIDGIDGLASGVSIVALTVYGTVLVNEGNSAQAMIAFATIGSLAAFIRYNIRGFARKRLKIFMGDSGSLAIGTILSICVIKVVQTHSGITDNFNPLIISFSALAVPSLDVVRVIIYRKRMHKPLFMPDKCHIHHKLLDMELSPEKALFAILAISILFIVLNWLLSLINVWMEMIIVVDVILYYLLIIYISQKGRYKKSPNVSL